MISEVAFVPSAIASDEATKTCILNVIVPAVKEVALSQVAGAVEDADPPSKPPVSFQVGAKCTPNLREKVTWDVIKHAWLLHVKKPTNAKHRTRFLVDPLLGAVEFESTKVKMYWDAVQEWNNCDGSTRLRIPVPVKTCTAIEGSSQSSIESSLD